MTATIIPDQALPPWWDEARVALMAADPRLAAVITRYPAEGPRGREDPLESLVGSIVSQLISTRAAAAVMARLRAAHPLTAAHLAAQDPEAIKACGVTRHKANAIVGLGQALLDGRLTPEAWPGMDDAAVMAQLVALRGIGPWTAQMLLIFHLRRPDVLPLSDVGLLRAVERVYGTREAVHEVSRSWAPWRSAATWYLWRSLDPDAGSL